MARKSAARAKLAPKPELAQNDKPPIEAVFNEIKDVFRMTVEANVRTAQRVDNLVAMRQLARDWYGHDFFPSIDKLKELQKISVDAYKEILAKVDEFDIEDFKKAEMKDYFEEIVPSIDSISDDDKLLEAHIIYLCVRDYGSKLVQAHQLFQQEMTSRGIEPVK